MYSVPEKQLPQGAALTALDERFREDPYSVLDEPDHKRLRRLVSKPFPDEAEKAAGEAATAADTA